MYVNWISWLEVKFGNKINECKRLVLFALGVLRYLYRSEILIGL